MAALTLPVSGPYIGTWNSYPFGVQNDDGFVLAVRLGGQEMNETDAWGLTLVEAIFRALNWTLRLHGLEWNKTGLLTALHSFGSESGTLPVTTLNPILGPIGDTWSRYSGALLLSSILGRLPSTPTSLTSTTAALAPNQDIEFMFTSKIREMPMAFVLFPYYFSGSTGNVVPFTTT